MQHFKVDPVLKIDETFYKQAEYIYIIKQDIHMLPIAGQTAGPNGLKFCVDTQRWPGGVFGCKKRFFSQHFFFHEQRPGPSASAV